MSRCYCDPSKKNLSRRLCTTVVLPFSKTVDDFLQLRLDFYWEYQGWCSSNKESMEINMHVLWSRIITLLSFLDHWNELCFCLRVFIHKKNLKVKVSKCLEMHFMVFRFLIFPWGRHHPMLPVPLQRTGLHPSNVSSNPKPPNFKIRVA